MTSRLALLATIALSWLGLLVHNVADLPEETVLSPSSSIPTLIYLVITVGLFTSMRQVAMWALLVWALIHLIGGAIISVLPLALLPFDPAQTIYHYSFHIFYGVMQVPLLAELAHRLRDRDRAPDRLLR